MLCDPDSAAPNLTILVPRVSRQWVHAATYSEALRRQGITLAECTTPESARSLVKGGCRVGLLPLNHEGDMERLTQWEPLVCASSLFWIGLIAGEIIASPRVRAYVSNYLFNFVTVPAKPEHIALALRHAWGMALMRNAQANPDPPSSAGNDASTMVGNSRQMHRVRSDIKKVARTDASVLIAGPSGTGKELAALSIHRQSDRANAPFVALNCGAIAPQLFQAELFGYEKGAFTGAHNRKIGRIEIAQGGTLFFDEIGDMPFDMQVNLLRFLQEKTIERVGGADTISIDVRVIAATHVDLAEAVRQRKFREDLYYRINVVCITIPPLAERGEDIEDIAKYYFAKFAPVHNRSLRGFSRAAMDALLNHAWPGNIRELVNRVQRATVMADGRFIQPEDLGFMRNVSLVEMMSLEDARAAAERVMISRALSQSRNRISGAATLLGISRVTLYRLMEKYHIRPGVGAAETLLRNNKLDFNTYE